MDAEDGAEPDRDLFGVCAAVLGRHGPDYPFAGLDSKGVGVCNGGPRPGRVRRQDREEASSYELYRYIDRNNYAADSFCNFYRELLKLPWTGGCGSYAVFRVSCDRCRKGYEYISASFDPSGGNDQREHIGI